MLHILILEKRESEKLSNDKVDGIKFFSRIRGIMSTLGFEDNLSVYTGVRVNRVLFSEEDDEICVFVKDIEKLTKNEELAITRELFGLVVGGNTTLQWIRGLSLVVIAYCFSVFLYCVYVAGIASLAHLIICMGLLLVFRMIMNIEKVQSSVIDFIHFQTLGIFSFNSYISGLERQGRISPMQSHLRKESVKKIKQ
ncbi:hypothetical protein ACFL08_04410 [Patescibacteria group bacterium]